MSWLKLSLAASAEQLEATEEALLQIGAVSVTVLPEGDELPWEPAPGAQPIASNNRIEALLSLSQDLEGLHSTLAQRLPASQLRSLDATFVGEQDWQQRALANAVSMQFGNRLWLLPKSAPAQQGPTIRLDPGLAFGTGSHPTTRLCLNALAQASLDDTAVLDYGCGSGILAIAAIKLGAAAATAVDYDPQALVATEDNAAYNGVHFRTCAPRSTAMAQEPASPATLDTSQQEGAVLHIALPEQFDTAAHYDVVVANILANPLIELAPLLQRALRPGGRLLLAGLLSEQAPAVAAAYDAVAFAAPVLDLATPPASELATDAETPLEHWCLLQGVKQ